MPDAETLKKVLTGLVQKQMLILGPNVAVGRARKVAGLTVADDGAVTGIQGDPDAVLKALVDEYVSLSGAITNTIVQSLIDANR